MEVLQKFSDPLLAKCEVCKGKVHKLISHSSFHLKGSGWYVTDYARKSANGSQQIKASGEKGAGPDSKGASEKSKKESASKSAKKE
jgi:putative FmdB family regulatory protein